MSNSTTKQSNISFLMPIQDRFNVVRSAGSGVAVIGTVFSGTININQEIMVVGNGKRVPAFVASMEMFRRPITRAEAGQNISILLHRMRPEEIVEGMAVVSPSNTPSYKTFKAAITLLAVEEGEEEFAHLFAIKADSQINLLLWDFHRARASISPLFTSPTHATPIKEAKSGDTVYATINLPTDIVLYEKFEFVIVAGHLKIATAVVTEVIG